MYEDRIDLEKVYLASAENAMNRQVSMSLKIF